VSRWSLGAFGALVVATVAAFFVTQHLKVTTPVIAGLTPPGTSGDPKPFNRRNCPRTLISFYLLHRADDVSVYVIDSSQTIVRTLAVGRHMRKKVRIPDGIFTWDGKEDNGSLAPDGTYHFRVGLINQGRTIDLTAEPILLKTIPPHPVVTGVDNALLPATGASARKPAVIHFTGTGGRGAIVRLYRTDLPGGPLLVKSSPTRWKAKTAEVNGLINRKPAPAGTYLVGLDVSDRACNTGHFPTIIPPPEGSTPRAGITIRYLAAQPPLDPVQAGSKALVYVDSRRRPYTWTLTRVGSPKPASRGNATTSPTLRVPIPGGGPGLYELSLRSGAYRTSVPLVGAAARPSGRMLVVLPALTWQGRNPGDEDGDGMPDTLDAGTPIQLNRPLAKGLPTDFPDEAGLLAFLDSAHLQYDLTTDLGLIHGVGPALAKYRGVVLAGSERWTPTSLSGPLRTYVEQGGHLLSVGIDSLRRGVTVQGGEALSPSGPSATDVLGAEQAPVAVGNGVILVVHDALGIFNGTSGAFGSGRYQPIARVTPPGQIVSSAGTSSSSSAIVGYRLGRGIVVDVGLIGFGSNLAHGIDAQELVKRLWAVLGG
jgi:hypothetical protein